MLEIETTVLSAQCALTVFSLCWRARHVVKVHAQTFADFPSEVNVMK